MTETLDGLSSKLPDLLAIKMVSQKVAHRHYETLIEPWARPQADGAIPEQESREAYLRIMAEAVLNLRPAGRTE